MARLVLSSSVLVLAGAPRIVIWIAWIGAAVMAQQSENHPSDDNDALATPRARPSPVWTVFRVSVAVLALIVIGRSIQYDDHLILNDRTYRIIERSANQLTVVDPAGEEKRLHAIPSPSDERVVMRVREPDGTEQTYAYRPGVVSLVKSLSPMFAFLAVLLFGTVPFLHTLRWRTLLNVQQIAPPFIRTLKLTFAGNLLSFFLISTTGGDLFKAYRIGRDTRRPADAFVSIFVDRFLGLAYIILFAGLLVLVLWRDPQVSQLARSVGVLVLLLCVAVAVLFSGRLRRAIRFERWSAKLPFAATVANIDQSLLTYRRHPWAMLQAATWTMGLQLLAALSTCLFGHALGVDAPVRYFLFYVPLAFLIGSVPISLFWGLGLLEGAYIVFFATSGLATPTEAAMLAMGTRLIQLLWALPGAAVLIQGQPAGQEP